VGLLKMKMNRYRSVIILILLFLAIPVFFCLGRTVSAHAPLLKDLYEIKLEDVDRLYFDIDGADIYFVKDLENVYISDELEFDLRGGRLRIYSPKKSIFDFVSRTHVVVVGTKNKYRLLDIDAGGLNLSGVLHAEELKINAGGIDMEGEYYIEHININGAGIDISGLIRGDYLRVNGAGIDIELDVIGLEEIRINGAGLDVDLKYLDGWEGSRLISVNAVGGELEVKVPADNRMEEDGHLEINKKGIIDVDVEYY